MTVNRTMYRYEGFGRSTLAAARHASDGQSDHCRQSSHQGLGVVYCIDARTDRQRQRQRQHNAAGENNNQQRHLVLVAGLLLWERADSKRRGWLERVRNEG